MVLKSASLEIAAGPDWRARWRAALRARDRLQSAVRIRWLVIGGFSVLALIGAYLGAIVSLRACVVGALVGTILNCVNEWALRRGRYVGAVTAMAVCGDQLIITFVVAQTGGVESPFVMMYVVQVVTSAMLVDELAAIATVAWAAVLWLLLLTFQSAGWVSIAAVSPLRYSSPILYQTTWTAFLLYCLGLMTYVGGRLARRLSRSESDLELRNRELQEAVTSLKCALERLRTAEGQLAHAEKMRSLGQLVAGVAHELNNPISFISANVEHLQNYVDRMVAMLQCYEQQVPEHGGAVVTRRAELGIEAIVDDLPALIADCQEGARRSKQIVDDLRLFSRGDGAERWQKCDLHDGIDSALSLLAHRFRPGVRVERNFGDCPEVECLPAQLNQVFLNLISNALDALGERPGTIRIATAPGAINGRRCAQVTIADDGCGMPREVQQRALEPFFTTKPMGQGTGLGLSICHGIIERHGGQLLIDSQPGLGASIVVRIPARVLASKAAGDEMNR